MELIKHSCFDNKKSCHFDWENILRVVINSNFWLWKLVSSWMFCTNFLGWSVLFPEMIAILWLSLKIKVVVANMMVMEL